MIDFLTISVRSTKKDVIEIYPDFIIKKSNDLMIRGGAFYAIWMQDRKLWSTDEQDAIQMIDEELDRYASENKDRFGDAKIKVLHVRTASTGMIDRWHKYCQKQMCDSYHTLDEKLIFANTNLTKKDYASKTLSYPLEKGDISAYDKLMSTLYSPEERTKIEWAIGSIVTGDSKKIQKFLVLYGAAGTGKSTVLNIIQQLFEGYYSVFDAKALGSSSNSFALEAFKTNPLVAIQHDGDLSKIEDNTRLNSLISHELMTVNEKFKSTYTSRFKCFLFMGTNQPVKITDAKSGLLRRLIDVSPTGSKLNFYDYNKLMQQISFELGAIAWHCREVYLENPDRYNNYVPINMLGASNDFYNFVSDSYLVFKNEDNTTLKAAWEMYKNFCTEARVPYPYSQIKFKEELKNYFKEFKDRFRLEDGTRVRNYYIGFRADKFEEGLEDKEPDTDAKYVIDFSSTESVLDKECASYPAQYANTEGTPISKWEKVKTKLSDLDTKRLHYVKLPLNHIVIDFDIPDEDGNKSFTRNLDAASKWPPTYAELSKSGAGIHLHYIYTGDASKLGYVYDDHIEIKVFTGNSSLRRKLSKCNSLPIASISSGLPLKGEKKVVNFDGIKNEKQLRTMIQKNLNKEYHNYTKPSIDFIYKILEDAYNSGMSYDVSDMEQAVMVMAASSTNNSQYCVKLVSKMHFKSDTPSAPVQDKDATMVFYDVEVFPNLFLVNFKAAGLNKPVTRMINPSQTDIEGLIKLNLVGFNCRRYDNHMLYARLIGYSNEQLYNLSQKIINGGRKSSAMFGEAYNISYTDIYDFASAGNKKSLKKLEIEMQNQSEDDLKKKGFDDSEIAIIKSGTHHQELGLPWDQPVPEDQWEKVAKYCDNDVLATEAAFTYLKSDWTARQILADLAGLTVNDTTNTLTQKIIFGNDKKPQHEFHYRNLAEPVHYLDEETLGFLKEACPEMMARLHGEEGSLLPYFPGYKFENGKSTYRGIEVREGGKVYAEPGMYVDVALLDIASMHPHSAIAEVLFGVKYTKAFREIVEGRVNIKHKAWDEVNHMFGGKLTPYIQRVIDGKMTAKQLADALKTAINSVYGLTFASFDNPFRDPRNKDNIVAKRGALFMVDLMYAVQEKGFTVAHIKTDSIKIPNATPEIIQFVMDFGKRYGYTFEHEATYEKMCLVNNAVYIAKYKDGDWTATGTQFQVPYVFKTLFSKEPIEFKDLCETKSVKTAMYLDFNEKLPEGEHNYRFVGKEGLFTPVKPGSGGGILVREATDKNGNIKYDSVTGTSGYRWMESEIVANTHKNITDESYYKALVNEAVDTIKKYGDFEWFASDDKDQPVKNEPVPDFMNIPELPDGVDGVPFDEYDEIIKEKNNG